MSAEIQAALTRAEEALAHLRLAVEAHAAEQPGEQPIGIKAAAHKFGISDRQLRRHAKQGCGTKIGGMWFIYASRILVPPQDGRPRT